MLLRLDQMQDMLIAFICFIAPFALFAPIRQYARSGPHRQLPVFVSGQVVSDKQFDLHVDGLQIKQPA